MIDIKRLVVGTVLGILAGYSVYVLTYWGLTPYVLAIFTFIITILAAILWH